MQPPQEEQDEDELYDRVQAMRYLVSLNHLCINQCHSLRIGPLIEQECLHKCTKDFIETQIAQVKFQEKQAKRTLS